MLILMRLLHIVAGAFWVGAVVFMAAFLIPTIRAVGPGGAPVMGHLAQVRRLPLVLLGAAWTTILSGAGLVWYQAGPLGFRWFSVGPGRVFGIGAVLAVIATVIGMTVSAPTARRIGAITGRVQAGGGTPSAEDQSELRRLQARITSATNAVAVLVILALMAMAVARYVR